MTEHPSIEQAEKTEKVEKAKPAKADEQDRPKLLKRLAQKGARLGSGRGRRLWLGSVVAAVALLAVLAVFVYRPDQQTDDAAARSAITAASDGVVAVYSYSSDTIDRDIAAAKSRLTGDLLSQYERDADTGKVAVAKVRASRSTAAVVGAAVSRLRPDSADVLVFLNLTAENSDTPAPQSTSGSLMVSMSKVDGKWLISAMKPV